ncbi:MAG: hypothetical protein LBG73_11110 [Spirochaetaceae bacterium]|jgi:hypothetical protein|nr:hypothetical protein [Spirochaetaceae bacterium]
MIDRKTLMSRHNPVYVHTKTGEPLSVGNGAFCVTVDFTGLQSFPQSRFPLCAMSDWGWHRYPSAPKDDSALRKTRYHAYGRDVAYATDREGQEELFKALRQNAHRFNLARISLEADATGYEDYAGIRQELSLWEGIIASSFAIRGEPVRAHTFVHPEEDTFCVRVESRLLKRDEGKLRIRLAFPYGVHKKSGGDFANSSAHTTAVSITESGLIIRRLMDETRYAVAVRTGKNTESCFDGFHTVVFTGNGDAIELSFRFAPDENISLPEEFERSKQRCIAFWETYWNEGAAIDFGGSTDLRAQELERRIVLSQYLSAIQCRGYLPPAETGLTCNSWYGKFHLEMHYWHCGYFALWNRGKELEKSLSYYLKILPVARRIAAEQGYKGARWPKMCDPSGYNTPSSIAVLLVWQQPHPIMLAELCYRCSRSEEFLRRYRDAVVESAEFMASFLHIQADGSAVLGPPVIPAQERHDPRQVLNPGFEVEYFRWGLRQANVWLSRLGEPPRPEFEAMSRGLSKPPAHEGVYVAHANCPQTFTEPVFHTDHPSMLAMLGMLPGNGIDREIMSRTLRRTLEVWDRESLWGWDFPLMAMTAARLNMPEDAVNLLLMDTPKNTYLANGHNPQADRDDLPLYLPGNGALLLAAGMMSAGWDDAPAGLGFPADPRWRVQREGFLPYI